MDANDLQNMTGALVAVTAVYAVGLIAVHVWYALALSKVFTKLGGEGWKAWVPILNEAELLAKGGVPAWSVIYYFIPVVQLYGLYLKFTALTRINAHFGRGVGSSVLGLLLAPVWASLLAWGRSPVPAVYDERVASMVADSPASEATGPLAAPAAVEPSFPVFSSEVPPPDAAPAFVAEVPAAPAPAPVAEPAAPVMIENPWAPRTPDAAPTPTVAIPPSIVAPTPPAAVVPPVVAVSELPVIAAPPAEPEPQEVPAPLEVPAPQPVADDFPVLPTTPEPIVEPTPELEPIPEPIVEPTPEPIAEPAPEPEPIATPEPIVEPTPEPIVEPAPEPAPEPTPAPEPVDVPTPLPESPAPAPADDDDDDDDDYAATVVVDRRPRLSWTLLLDDGRAFALTEDRADLGRKPDSTDADVQLLPIPDETRTLSKTHARLELVDGQWTVTDLKSTNGVIVIGADGAETLIAPSVTTPVLDRFILGKVGMRIAFEEGVAS